MKTPLAVTIPNANVRIQPFGRTTRIYPLTTVARQWLIDNVDGVWTGGNYCTVGADIVGAAIYGLITRRRAA